MLRLHPWNFGVRMEGVIVLLQTRCKVAGTCELPCSVQPTRRRHFQDFIAVAIYLLVRRGAVPGTRECQPVGNTAPQRAECAGENWLVSLLEYACGDRKDQKESSHEWSEVVR